MHCAETNWHRTPGTLKAVTATGDPSSFGPLEQQISEEEGVWPKGNLYHIEMEQLASPLLLTRFDPRIAGSLL